MASGVSEKMHSGHFDIRSKHAFIDNVMMVYINTSQYPCEDGSLQSVCPVNGHYKEESACYHTKCQSAYKRRSEVSKLRSAVLVVAVLILS